MKGIIPVFVIISMFFIVTNVKNARADEKGGSQDVLKELDDFQRSLSGWMKNLDSLGTQFSTLQKSVGEGMSPLREFDKTMKGLEEKLNTTISKMESIEKTASVAEIKGLIDSFGKTLDVLKKLLSDLAKRVEDQEIKTTVLEKRYQEAQRPLEPVKKAIEDLNKLMTDKLGEQEKKIGSIEDSVKTHVASLDSTAKAFEGQMKVVSDLESRLKKVEKTGGVTTGTVTAETSSVAQQLQATSGTETVKVAEGTGTSGIVAETKGHIPTPEEEGFTEMEDGFYIRNVNLFPFGSSSLIKGEVKNASDRDRSIATFTIRIYNATDMLLFTQDFSIKTFKQGDIRAFKEIVSGYTPIDIARYEIMPKRRY